MSQFPNRRCHQASLPKGDCPAISSLLALLESVPALLWETDANLCFTALTGAALLSMGVSAERYAGRTVRDLFSPAGDAQKAGGAHEIALLGQTGSFEVDVNGRDLHACVKPLRGPDGAIAGVIGIALDMTERMVAERALRLSEYSYRSLIEEAPYAICRSTIGGELLQVNRAMTEMLGYDPASSSELLLRDLPLIFAPAGSFEAFQKALLDGGSHPGTDTDWLRRDGHTIQVRVSGRVLRDPSREVSYLDVFAENVTAKKQLEAELSQAQRMQAIGQLAGGVAHDFNNLLTVIGGHVEIMLSEPRDAESRERLEQVQQAAVKAALLTKQLLAFSRRQVLRVRTVDLNEVIGKLMGMLGRVIKENVELVFVPGDLLGSVQADPNEIERVLVNLAVNAQDAMPAGGRLTIETSNVCVAGQPPLPLDEFKAGDYVQILVRDTGIGMDRETQARAFEPFFTTKQPNEGTGLGLSVVYGVVRQSGGYVRLESEPGLGTTFRIYLPRGAADPVPAHEALSVGSLPLGSETILFAEDDEAIRQFVADALNSLGYHVLSAPDGVAAMSVAQSHPGPIHMLLTDLVMPMVGGRELAQRLKGADPDLKVVFVSGYAGHALAEKELELPSVCFLQKPFSMESLANTVRGVLDGLLP
jgi:PAS domain S-box-containing protein